ncbi:recombinase family protein [Williamsia muralis]|uniref:Recombinase family protein n=1 Tax=Williamsia marianensis TaxID=85044 RepID=A0ABU4EW50_WILMA|nr:recombinase family protein [Williamsia muralis]MDV7135480.1 recombinase family protein [Williamsia muralis]
MRTAIYLRQSQDRDGTEYGVERQREQVAKLVAQRDWIVTETFVDNDVSATSRKPRPQFERMMAGVEAGEFDVIVARHMDRLTRRLSDLERVLTACEAAGVIIVTAADGVDTSTDGGRLVARILGSVAQGEVERKSARQRAAVVQAAKQGRWVGGRRAFGYEGDGMTVRETEADMIRRGYEAVLGGEPVTAVARMWNEAGFVTTQTKRDGSPNAWQRSGVRDVLLNPRNAGLRRHRPVGGHGEFRKNPESYIVGKAQWPAIVDEDTYRATARLLTAPERRSTVVNAQALLTGVARCQCGSTVNAGGARRNYRTYRCKDVPSHLARMAAPADAYVEAIIVERLSRPDALEVFAPAVAADTRDFSTEADTLRRRLEDLAVDYADGVLTREQFATVNERVRARLAHLEAEMAAAGATDLVAPLVGSGDVAAAWADLATARKRGVIDALATITLMPPGRGTRTFREESVVIEWRTDRA